MHRTRPFAAHEWLIAWRYLRARRAEGGVSVMTAISLVGIALAVFALIATMSVRSGFRHEFVGTILGANPHVTLYGVTTQGATGETSRLIGPFDAIRDRVGAVDGVTQAFPLIRGQVLASHAGRNAGVEVHGIRDDDLARVPLVAEPAYALGDLGRFGSGVALGAGVARELNLQIGDRVRLVSPDGVKTAFGVSPRVKSYEVVYIFSVGRYDIDRTRVYMPFSEAQAYFNREAGADEIFVSLADPDRVDELTPALIGAAGRSVIVWSWKDSSGAFLQALKMEDNVMFIILSILVLIAALNIVSGLVMLVKNKGRDIGILRTIGLSRGGVMRVFFLCGASVGIVGTVAGVVLGVLFTQYIDPIFDAVNWIAGGGVWDPSVRFLSRLPARLEWGDVGFAVAMSLGLSFLVTILPARRAASLDPVEALRHE